MNNLLQLKNISMTYQNIHGETIALQNINLNVDQGEFLSIVGPSGCGKSTLLSIICGLLEPSSGLVLINLRPLKESDIFIGYMLQGDQLFEWRTIFQNAVLGLELKNLLTMQNINYVKGLLNKYGLREFIDYYPAQISGGMRQRVALIRTLALNPKILLLDEPFSALDYQTRLSVSDEILKIIKQEKKTAILVTHDIEEAISMSDRVITLTSRPATILNSHKILLPQKGAIEARRTIEFGEYFDKIWRELKQ